MSKKKIYPTYKDFYTAADLKDPEEVKGPRLNLENFDAKGRLRNLKVHCVATDLDPGYIKDATQPTKIRKFQLKTDILRLREIVRKKFVIYAAQERVLEKKLENENDERQYRKVINFMKISEELLRALESQAFEDMRASQRKLQKLEETKLENELKIIKDEYQCVMEKTQNSFSKCLYLLKLASYFDGIEKDQTVEMNEAKNHKMKWFQYTDEGKQIIYNNCEPLSHEHLENLRAYLKVRAKPYLKKENHLNSDIWLKCFENTTEKVFNYEFQLKELALLNYIQGIISRKFEKIYAIWTTKQIRLYNTELIEKRVEILKLETFKVIKIYEKGSTGGKIYIKLNAVIPLILEKIEEKTGKDHINGTNLPTQFKEVQENSILIKMERIHTILMNLLHELNAVPPKKCEIIERQIRKRKRFENEKSRRALIQENRMKNWINHFKKHRLKNKYISIAPQ